MQQISAKHIEAIHSWAIQAWNWFGEELAEFGVRWLVFCAVGVVMTVIFRSRLRKDLDRVIEHLGIDQTHSGIKPRKILNWLKPTAKPPATKAWIKRQEALALIKKSSVVMEKILEENKEQKRLVIR